MSGGSARPPRPARSSVTSGNSGYGAFGGAGTGADAAGSPVASVSPIATGSLGAAAAPSKTRSRSLPSTAKADATIVPSHANALPSSVLIRGVDIGGSVVARIVGYLPPDAIPPFRRSCLLFHTVTAKLLQREGKLRGVVEAFLETKRLNSKRVWVVVRARPADGAGNCLSIDRNRVAVSGAGNAGGFAFISDRAFDGMATQADVCDYIGSRVLPHALNGEHVCLMAYGQTGSGKTHTMFGSLEAGATDSQGLAFRAINMLAALLRQSSQVDLTVDFSFLEVYNDELYDLLDGSKRLSKQRSSEAHVVPMGLTRRRCSAVQMETQVHEWLREGAATRTVGKTVFNPRSSRSHGIVLLHLCWGAGGEKKSASRLLSRATSKLAGSETRIYLVDLAGSERAGLHGTNATQEDQTRLKEGEAINLSLSALGRVVGALATGKSKHVPYRDSALTWLLKDAITGTTARVCMVAAVHPNHAQESSSTLRYAKQYSSLQTSTGTKLPDLTAEVRTQQRKVDNLKALFTKAMEGEEHGIGWTIESLSGTMQPSRTARELVDAHPYLTWTATHQSKWATRGQRRDRSGIGRIRTIVDVPDARPASDPPDGRLTHEALAAALRAVERQGDDAPRPDRCAEIVFEGRHGRPPVVLWYPEMALEEVRPPQTILDAKAALEKAEADLAQKRGDLKAAQEFVANEKKEWMARDS